MEYQKLLDIVVEYIERSTKAKDSQKFCNNFMEEFYNLQDRLEKKVSQELYELFDDINIVCDSYESNVKIREMDKYCIDQIVLRNKVIEIYNKIVA